MLYRVSEEKDMLVKSELRSGGVGTVVPIG